MAIQTFQPKCSVVLKKNVGRTAAANGVPVSERFKGSKKTIDLTPYLGAGGSVVVSRSTREPAGMWSVTLTDQINPDASDSLYGLIEPMDVVEIRMAHDPSVYGAAGMPIMMRGFVSEVRRGSVMGHNGPMRAVTLSGQDYGKILQIMRIEYLPGTVIGEALITNFKLFQNYGVTAEINEDAAVFIGKVMTDVVNTGGPSHPGFISQMISSTLSVGSSQSPVQLIGVDAEEGSGVIAPFGAQEFDGGAIYDLMKYFGDVGAWNELYIEDRVDAPYLVYRPTPFKDASGFPIQNRRPIDEPIVVSDESLVSIDVARTDVNVVNYYWVNSPRYNQIDGTLLQSSINGRNNPPPDIFAYPNSALALYGVRVMRTDSQQGARADGLPEAAYKAGQNVSVANLNAKRAILIANNADNVVFEQGDLVLRGDERIQHGRYLRLMRGTDDAGAAAGKGSKSEYYGHKVTHIYSAFRSYFTAVEFDRGTGFIERVQKAAGAGGPYLSEMAIGGTYAAAS